MSGQDIFKDRDAEFVFSGLAFPSVVDTFAVLQVVRYPQPELGVFFRYATPRDPTARFDLYVYPIPASEDAADTARAEFERALEGIKQYAEQNPRSFVWNLEVVDSLNLVDPAGRSYRGWRAESAAQEGSVAQRDHLYVFVNSGRYFKYRLAHATATDAQMRPRVETFIMETLTRVRAAEP